MPDDWLAQAAAVPVAFAQVREDPRVDLAVLDRSDGSELNGLMVASGGCTAAVLAESGRFARLRLVDVNPAQLALAKFKLDLLGSPREYRLAVCGHAPMRDRADVVGNFLGGNGGPPDLFGPVAIVGELGLDHCGRYELLFAQLRRAMGPAADAMPSILARPDAAGWLAPGTHSGDALDAAFDEVMALPNLVALFGEGATANRVEPFARHFARRTRVALATLPTADNPFLWQLLVGRFPPGTAYDWFDVPVPPRATVRSTVFERGTITDMLAHADRASYDFVHLSNVLDWLTPPQARHTLTCAADALRPGGLVVIRQLNSTLSLDQLGPDFDWLDTTALHAADRSFFYRRLYLGRRR